MNIYDLEKYISGHAHAHLIGIGGVSMAPLAEVLQSIGVKVSGSDISESESVLRLRSLGIEIAIGHDAENIKSADLIVRTAAAREAGIPVFERAEAWGYIMRSYKNAICISGTHGKTTTTSMVTHIFMDAQCDPTVMIGGTLPLLKAGHRVGGGDTIIMESCEYYNSFLSFSPTVAVILNVDADHLDFFKDLEDVKSSFKKFAELVPESGFVVANGDDANTLSTISGLDRNIVTFGISENCDVKAENIITTDHGTNFDLIYKGEKVTTVSLSVPGIHNVKNALAAAASALILGVDAKHISESLSEFHGAGRRFEFKGTYNGADIYDDYAHHPSELHALLDAALSLPYNRVILCFQPHTYTRTKALFNEFITELGRPHITYLSEIYAAREQNTIVISSSDLAEKIPGSKYLSTFEELESDLREIAQEGDLILTVGAGNIYRVGENLVK